MSKLSFEQKQEFVTENINEFFKSPKTSSEDYQKSFNELDIEKQYATILRWKKYNEKKAAGELKPRTATKKQDPIAMLMNGMVIDITSDEATAMIAQFETAIATLNAIIENNKIQEKQNIEEQIKMLQSRLKELK